MTIAWDAGTAISGDGDVSPGSPYARVLLDTIPDYLSQSLDDPPRYWRLGVVGGIDGDYRSEGTRLLYAAQEFTVDIPVLGGLYWSLELGVSGTLYRGIGTMADDQVACVVYRSGSQTLTNGNTTNISFDLERSDPWGMHSATVNPTRITVPVPGYYVVGVGISWAANVTGYRRVALVKNAATKFLNENMMAVTDAGITARQTIERTVWLDGGDYVEAQAQQLSGGNLDVIVDAEASVEMWVVKVA